MALSTEQAQVVFGYALCGLFVPNKMYTGFQKIGQTMKVDRLLLPGQSQELEFVVKDVGWKDRGDSAEMRNRTQRKWMKAWTETL
jgi:hypothetical protein